MNTIVQRMSANFLCAQFAGHIIAQPPGSDFWMAIDIETHTIMSDGYYQTALGVARFVQRTNFAKANPNYDGTH